MPTSSSLQNHDENLRPGSTTKGSFVHGKNPKKAVKALSDQVKEGIKSEVRKAESIGIMLDESQDVSKREMLAIVAKLVVNGRASVRLLKMVELKDQSAKGLFAEFKKMLKEFDSVF